MKRNTSDSDSVDGAGHCQNKELMDSPGLSSRASPQLSDDRKDTQIKSHSGCQRNDDYENFRREKNKQAARDFRDRQKKIMMDLNQRVHTLEKEKKSLSQRLMRREIEVQLYEQQIADYRDLLLLYSAKYGIEGIVVSPTSKPADSSPVTTVSVIKGEDSPPIQAQQLQSFEVCV